MGRKSTKAKPVIPTLTAIRKLIREATFDPRKDASVSFILEVSSNPDYLLGKVMEYVVLARNTATIKDKRDSLIMAIRLILIYMFYHAPSAD